MKDKRSKEEGTGGKGGEITRESKRKVTEGKWKSRRKGRGGRGGHNGKGEKGGETMMEREGSKGRASMWRV